MFFAVIARDRPDSGAWREALRDRHLAYLGRHRDNVVFAGATFDADDVKDGSLMVVEAESLEDARKLAGDDPFVTEGLYQSFEVKRWTFGVDNTASSKRSP